ncbi:MAG TPA: DHA2 family efflux MFS transporter permease subunit [Steroidobacteraceae bacterium]|nr:DHA2 family efflux MFS transporter permease subunit [Steroidobacteraceae bacterium]
MSTERPALAGPALALVTLALALGNFMEVLDTTIANVAVPHIAGDLGVSPTQATWVITSYAVANAVSVLLSGWLAQRFGQVRMFVSAVLLFTLASWLCGMAPSFELLLAFRIMQGSVSGLMVPLSQTLLLSSYPPQKQGIALAIWGMTIVVAPVIGPILGGWLTDVTSWPWIFYINVPVGIAVAVLTSRLLAGRETPTRRLPVDTVGLALIVIWVGALQIMLDKGNELDWFDSRFIDTLAIVAALGLALFVVWELTEKHPMVDLRLFRLRNFTAGTLSVSLGFAVFFGNVVLLPLWLQTQMGYTSTWAGLAVAPYGILAFLLSPAVGKNLGRVDPRLFATAAFGVFALASFWRAGYTPDADFRALALPQLLQGAGIAMYFAPLMAISLGGLPPERMAFGSGLANFFRITAGSFGASLVTTLWQRREAVHRTQLVEHITAYSPHASGAVSQLQHAGFTPDQALGQVNAALTHQTTLLAATDIFWLSGWLFLLLIASVWVAKKPFGAAPVGAH